MKKRQKWFIILGAAIVLMVIFTYGVIRYVPWNKLMKVPTSSEVDFLQQDPMHNVAPNTLSFDFEVDSTQEVPNGIYKGIAHSGHYSAKVFGKNSFSISVVRDAGDIGLENLDGVAISAWVYAFPTNNEVNGSLVFAANNSVGVNICWKGVHFNGPLIPQGKWTKVSAYFDLSDVRLRLDDKIQLYFWNNSSTDLLVDDFYYVFGAPQERLGDSAGVDMTKEEGDLPKFNYPPFQLSWMQKQDIGNKNGISLIKKVEGFAGEISPADQVIAGNFITNKGALQSILVINAEGKPVLFHYCQGSNKFEEVSLDCPADLFPILRGFTGLKGSFLPGSGDQLFVAGPEGIALLGFETASPPCSKSASTARVKVLWRSAEPILADITLHDDRQVTSGDLNGNGKDELLLFDKEGSWKILQFSPSGASSWEWKMLASGEEYRIREWNRALVEFKATSAPYLSDYKNDLVLTRFRDLKSGKDAYTLLRFLPGDNKFVKVFHDRHGSLGMTIGIDTLKLTDQLIPGIFHHGKPISFLRYNRDWRYNLKDIRFNDSTFQILASIDFAGYDRDRNPKYYEILKLHAGNWLDPDVTSLLVIGRNCKDQDYKGGNCNEYEEIPDLPNTLQLYSFSPNKP